MGNSTAYKIIIKGIPVFWMILINESAMTITNTGPNRLLLDNITPPKMKAVRPPSASATPEYYELTRADDAKIQFPKTVLVLDGTKEDDDANFVKSGSSTGGTPSGEMDLSTNEGDIDSLTWTEFVKKVTDNLGAKWLLVMSAGDNHAQKGAEADEDLNGAGFYYMIGKFNNDPDFGVSPVQFTFVSTPLLVDSAAAIAAFTDVLFVLTPIVIKGVTPVRTIAPPALIAADVTKLIAGQVVVKPSA